MKGIRSARWRFFYGLFALVSIIASCAIAQSSTLVERLDSIAGAGVREDRAVGTVVAVVKGREPLLIKAYGQSDVEGDVPMTVDTVIPIGSVTKQFTAAAILQLRDQGKLGLDDDITKWLPDFETRGNKVTLRHLLSHTSGIVDLTEMPELRGLTRNPTLTRDDIYAVIRRYPFQFPTGTMQTYSNSGFWLLGLVIEKASGMTYEEYVEKKLFEPLGMKRSMYCNSAEEVPRRAWGHGLRNGIEPFVHVHAIVHTGTYAAGALCSTAEDMITWLQALHGGKVLTPESYVEMTTPTKLDDGTPLRSSLGLFVGEDSRGLRQIGHDGGGFGFGAVASWYPDAQLFVVVLTNSQPTDIRMVSDDLAAAVLPLPRPAGPFTGDAALLVGTYKGPGRGRELVIEVTQTPQGIAFAIDGAAASPLPWVEGWTFRETSSPSALLTIRRSTDSGPATELRYDRGGGHFILKRQ